MLPVTPRENLLSAIYYLRLACACLWLASACNRPVELIVNPEGIAGAGTPEFNFLVVPGPYSVSSLNDGMSGVGIELYLRQLSFDADAAYFFEFTSNNYGSFEVEGDTLYTGDKVVLPYRLFKKYRLKIFTRFYKPGHDDEWLHVLHSTKTDGFFIFTSNFTSPHFGRNLILHGLYLFQLSIIRG